MTGSASAFGRIKHLRYNNTSYHAAIFYHNEADYSSANILNDVLYIIYLCGGLSDFGFFTRSIKHNRSRLQVGYNLTIVLSYEYCRPFVRIMLSPAAE